MIQGSQVSDESQDSSYAEVRAEGESSAGSIMADWPQLTPIFISRLRVKS